MEELNVIIGRLEELGASAKPFSKGDIKSDGGLTFNEFSAWFVEQTDLPEEFLRPNYAAVGGVSRGAKRGMVAGLANTATNLVKDTVKNAAMQPMKLIDESAKLAKKTMGMVRADSRFPVSHSFPILS